NRHFQFESLLSLSGSNADERYTHKPSETGAVALALLAALGGPVTAPALPANVKDGVAKAAKELMASKGKGLVVSGSNNVNIQIIVNAINEAIGAGGNTVDWATPLQTRQGIDSDMNTLIADLNDGKVGALIIYGVNPVYDHRDADKFVAGLKKTKVSVSFNDRLDETTEQVKLALPAPHFLESWGDTEAKPGYFSFLQPTIAPLFKTRPFEDSLLKWAGNPTNYEAFFKQYWTAKLGSVEAYETALQNGIIEPAAAATGGAPAYNGGKVGDAASALASIKGNGPFEIVIYQSVLMGVGAQGNNPWLHEVPDPMTKVSWDNYAIISPK